MEANRYPMAQTNDGAGPSKDSKILDVREIEIPVELFKTFENLMEVDDWIVNQIRENNASGRYDLNCELVIEMIDNIREVRNSLTPIYTEFNKLSEKEIKKSIKEYVDSESREITREAILRAQGREHETLSIQEELLKQRGPREEDEKSFLIRIGLRFSAETNFIFKNEDVKKEYIRVILENEKKRKIPNYEEENKKKFYELEIAEKIRNLTRWTVEQKIRYVENYRKHEREIERPVLMEIEEVPFSALGEDGPMGDLIRELDLIFDQITEIIGNSTGQLEKEVLVECTRSCLRRIKQQLDKERLTITID